jgi:hypothetical protein
LLAPVVRLWYTFVAFMVGARPPHRFCRNRAFDVMVTPTVERVSRISEKVRKRSLSIALGPPIPESVISTFESLCGCILPEGYRTFLKELGDGAKGPPYYGLLRFGELPPDLSKSEVPQWNDVQRVRRPFPFTELWVWEDGDTSNEGEKEQVSDGTLHLGTDGCGQYWLLVVTGPERGNVWMLADVGITPTRPKRDFLQWFEDWLDGNSNWWQ